MELDILNELMGISKKSEASKSKRELYVEQVGILLSEEGFSRTAIEILKN